MNVKNNKRRRDSIDRIQKAFINFIEEKKLHEITVSDICKEAGINRSTFYSNFLDVYDLSEKITEKLHEEVMALYHDEIKGNKKSDYIKLFCHIRDNQSMYRTYFRLENDKNNSRWFYNKQLEGEFFADDKIDYHVEFFRNGFNALIKMWLFNGCPESPEELEAIIEREYKGRTSFIDKYFLKESERAQ